MAKENLNNQVGDREPGGVGALLQPVHTIWLFLCKYMYWNGKSQVLVAEAGGFTMNSAREVTVGRPWVRKGPKKGLPGVALFDLEADLIF